MNLDVLTSETAPEASRAILDGIATDLGFVPNLAAVAAASPTLLAAFDGLRRVVGVRPFNRCTARSPEWRSVSPSTTPMAWPSTPRCSAALGVDEPDIDEMRAGSEPNDPVHAAVYRFARAIAVERGQVGDDVVEQAYDAGLSDTDLLQLVAECVFAGLVGIIDNLAGRVPLDEFLLPRQWKA